MSRSSRQLHTVIALMSIMLLFFISEGAKALPLTGDEKNFEALNEAAVTANSMLIDALGSSDTEDLLLSGSFSGSGFSFSLAGSFSASVSVSLGFTGAFNSVADQVAFSSTGPVGTSTWSETGAYNFDESNPAATLLTGSGSATITDPSGKKTEEDHENFHKQLVVTTPDDMRCVNDDGTYDITKSGKFVRTENQKSMVCVKNPPAPQIGMVSVTTDDTLLSGTADFSAGTVAETITAAPEPGTLSVLGSGLFALMFYRRRKSYTGANQHVARRMG